MDDVNESARKTRTASAASSSSSVIEYVNEAFIESELELSKVVTKGDLQFLKNPLSEEPFGRGPLVENEANALHGFTSSQQTAPRLVPCTFRKMYLASLAVLLFAVCMGMTVTYSATAINSMRSDRSISPDDDDVTWIGSLVAVGALIGGSAAGYFSEKLGRKGTLIFNSIPFVMGWLIIAYAESIGFIFCGRIMTGFCCGIVSVTTPMYLVEISTPEVRGLLGASFQLFVVIGVLLVSLLGSQLSWTWLAVSGAITSTIAAALMVPMPESPRWLMSQQRHGEAINEVLFLQGEHFDVVGECRAIEEEIKRQPEGKIQLKEFLTPTVYKPILLSIALMFFQQFSGVNAVMFYTVDIFEAAGSSLNGKTATILVAVIQVLATLLSSVLMDRAGRKPLLAISGLCMALSLTVFGGFDFAATGNIEVRVKYGWLPLACLMVFIAAFSIGFGPTPWLMVAEMTPARFRSISSGIATALNWTFVFIITKTFKAMENGIHDYGVYWTYASFCIVSCFVTYFFLPETKGKTMDEIQKHFALKRTSISKA